jgi:hypothetical protein
LGQTLNKVNQQSVSEGELFALRDELNRCKAELDSTQSELTKVKVLATGQHEEIIGLQKTLVVKTTECLSATNELLKAKQELSKLQEAMELSHDLKKTKEELLQTTAQLSRYLNQNQSLLSLPQNRGANFAGMPSLDPAPQLAEFITLPVRSEVASFQPNFQDSGSYPPSERQAGDWERARQERAAPPPPPPPPPEDQDLYDSAATRLVPEGSGVFGGFSNSGFSTPLVQSAQPYGPGGGSDGGRRFSTGEDNRILDTGAGNLGGPPSPRHQRSAQGQLLFRQARPLPAAALRAAEALDSAAPSWRGGIMPFHGSPAAVYMSPGGPGGSVGSVGSGRGVRLELTPEELRRAGLNPDHEISV